MVRAGLGVRGSSGKRTEAGISCIGAFPTSPDGTIGDIIVRGVRGVWVFVVT